MNNWNITGHCADDAETRCTKKNEPIVSFRVAVKSGYGENEKTIWVRCSLFGNRGAAVSQYLTKGQLVGVTGEMSAGAYIDKQGNPQPSIDMRVNDVTLLGKKDGAKPAERPAKPAQKAEAYQSDFDSEVPF